MANIESQITSFDITARKRFSRKLDLMDAGVSFMELFILAMMLCGVMQQIGKGTYAWHEITLMIAGCGVMVFYTWKTFKDLYAFCMSYKGDQQVIKTCIDVVFDDVDEYKKFRMLVAQHAAIPFAQMIVSSLHASDTTVAEVNVDMTEIQLINRQKRAVVRVWGTAK